MPESILRFQLNLQPRKCLRYRIKKTKNSGARFGEEGAGCLSLNPFPFLHAVFGHVYHQILSELWWLLSCSHMTTRSTHRTDHSRTKLQLLMERRLDELSLNKFLLLTLIVRVLLA